MHTCMQQGQVLVMSGSVSVVQYILASFSDSGILGLSFSLQNIALVKKTRSACKLTI